MKKAELLKGFLNWITEDKFSWTCSCRCWDALFSQFASNDEERRGGCLYSAYGRLNFKEKNHSELEKFGFTFEELRDFEFLIKFWEGEKGFFNEYGEYCLFGDTNDINSRYYIYSNGISYIKEWITHLESKDKTERPEKVYVTFRIDSKLLDKQLQLN